MIRRSLRVVFALVVVGFVVGCASPRARVAPPLVLISLDGFRWDYPQLHAAETPTLREMMRTGVSAERLIPVFPSNTFPNHYSVVTGLYPARHGLINNTMFDPVSGEFFRTSRPGAVAESRWWGGEPIWVTAIKQGGRAGCWFWPGSEAEIAGVRPDYWRPYDGTKPFEERLDELMTWLARPGGASGPVIATFYLEEANSVGHREGPGSPELATTIGELDRRLATLRSRLALADIAANLVIVSDHGMTPISPARVALLDDYIDLATVQVDFDGSVVGLRPIGNGKVDALVAALSRIPRASVYRAEDLPPRFHLRNNPRIPPIWIIPEEGHGVYRRAQFESFRDRMSKADHGYDPALLSMQGILIAHGPSFRRGVKIGPVENVHIYNLLCATLGLRAAANDGDDRLARSFLRTR